MLSSFITLSLLARGWIVLAPARARDGARDARVLSAPSLRAPLMLEAAMPLLPHDPLSDQSDLLVRLAVLEEALHAFGPADGPSALVDASLCVLRALPPTHGAALYPEMVPSDCASLAEFSAYFTSAAASGADSFGQHLFNAQLLDDSLGALARAISVPSVPELYLSDSHLSRSPTAEAAAAIAAAARFLLLPPSERIAALDVLAASVASETFIAARRSALGVARHRRITRPRAKTVDAADAAVAADDEDIIRALYNSVVQQLGDSFLSPMGFPASALGLRCLVGADRAAGSQRAAAALGRVWHAADAAAPIIFTPAAQQATAEQQPRAGAALEAGRGAGFGAAPRARTLVVAFSSLGWFGVVRAEWGATLRAADGESFDVAHALDTSQSWFTTNPMSGDFDDGRWWDESLGALCAPYERVCFLGESMGATGALRFARLSTGSVVSLVPQIELGDFPYADRADFGEESKRRLREQIQDACRQTSARVRVHVGLDAADLRQLEYLPADAPRVHVTRWEAQGHALGAGLKEQGVLQETVLQELLGC